MNEPTNSKGMVMTKSVLHTHRCEKISVHAICMLRLKWKSEVTPTLNGQYLRLQYVLEVTPTGIWQRKRMPPPTFYVWDFPTSNTVYRNFSLILYSDKRFCTN